MFYAQSDISSVLVCQTCDRSLFEPKALPCGTIICGDCALNIQNSLISEDVTSFIECTVCKKRHLVDKNEGLPTSMILSKLLEKKPEEVCRSELVDLFKSKLSLIKSQTDKLRSDLAKGADLIELHCLELRNQVQLETELQIMELYELNTKLINEINDYKVKCLENFHNNNEEN